MPEIDRRLARRRFDRAARSYTASARLETEVGSRMIERLDYVRIRPRRILDAGSGPGRWARALAGRYPGAEVVALDYSLAMLKPLRPRPLRLLRRRAPRPVCGELARLPLRDGALELVWSNMALHWLSEPLPALAEFHRVLAAGSGLLMFSTLGPDSLKELREAAGAPRVHAFVDMHDLGDMLLACGFSDPVVDMELLTFTYRDAEALLADLRATGQTSARADRARGLAGKAWRERLRAALEQSRRATFEVVYGHAWKGELRRERNVIHFQPRSLR